MFFPFLDIDNFENYITIYNFPPNNWEIEKRKLSDKWLNISWLEENKWISKKVTRLEKDQILRLNDEDIKKITDSKNIKIFSLTEKPLNENVYQFPNYNDILKTTTPAWRSTLGIKKKNARTSYQGEIYPFPEKGKILSICPFVQINEKNIENYLLFVNLELNPTNRKCLIEIKDNNNKLIDKQDVFSNKVNVIKLNDLKFELLNSYLLIESENILGIPIYLSYSRKDNSLSLEHSHPPASYSIHGDRKKVQELIKKNLTSL